MKKVLGFLTCVLLCLGMLSGCFGTGDPVDVTIDGDYTKLTGTIRFLLPGDAPDSMDEVTAAINAALAEDGRNYTVDFTFETWGDYWNKVGLRANDGYDACWMHADNLAGFYNSVLKDLTPYMEPYGSEILKLTSELYLNFARVDGGLYAIPRVEPLSEESNLLAVRGDWMDEFGMESITTLPELETYFSKSAEKMAETPGAYVMDKDHSDYLRRVYAKNYYFPLGSFSKYPVYIDLSNPVDGSYKVENFYTSQAFLDMAAKAEEYYDAGYRNPNRSSLASDSIDNAFNNGLLAAVWSSPTKTSERIDAFKSLNPEGSIYNVILNPDETKWISSGGNMLAVYKASSKAAHVVDFYNWVLSDQAHTDLVCYGILNKNYKLTEDGKLDFTGISNSDNYSLKFPSFVFSTLTRIRYSKSMDDKAISSITEWDSGENVQLSPLAGFVPEIKGILNTAYSLVAAAEKSYSEDFLYGSKSVKDEEVYQQFLNQLNAPLTYNGQKVPAIEIVITELQAQVDAFIAEKAA